jgi:hypothetical protein
MAKMKRLTVGSVIKSKDPAKSNYLKFNLGLKGGSMTVKDGQTLSVESKAYQLKSLEAAVQAGKLSEENAAKARARIEKIPDFVLGEIILLESN